MSDFLGVISNLVDDIWKDYDKDCSGFLDIKQAKAFFKNTLKELGEDGEFSEADFEANFKELDRGGDGTISKDEMIIFIKKMCGY